MKNILKLIAFFGLPAIVLVLIFSSCKKQAAGSSTDLGGKWVKTNFRALEQYQFSNDETFSYDVLATDSVTKKVIGYYAETTGHYTFKNDSLYLYNLVILTNKAGGYGPATDLVSTSGSQTETYAIKLDNSKNRLSLYFSCPLNADCVPSPLVYERQ